MLHHTVSVAGAALALLLMPAREAPATFDRETIDRPPCRARAAAPANLGGAPWTLAWDDSLDATLDRGEKRCVVALDSVDSAVTGSFRGPVLGEPRTCVFTGELVQGGALLLLQQREPGYVCSYQLGADGPGWSGTWRDGRGRCGTAVLHRPPMDLDL